MLERLRAYWDKYAKTFRSGGGSSGSKAEGFEWFGFADTLNRSIALQVGWQKYPLTPEGTSEADIVAAGGVILERKESEPRPFPFGKELAEIR